MACNAYLADITDPKHLTKRVAIMSGGSLIGINIGKGLSGVINEELGFMYNFAFGMLSSVLTAVYAIVFLKNSVRLREMRLHHKTGIDVVEMKGKTNLDSLRDGKQLNAATTHEKIRQLFSFKNIRDGMK